MPNQMIALQARSPQLPDPSRRTAQFVNMMNMTRQQEAAQRQTMQAQQAMDIEAAKEARAAALHGPALTKAQQDNIIQALEIFREGVADVAEGDIAAAEAVRADLVARVPGWDKVLPPATSWDRNTRYGLMMKADKEIDKTITTPVASKEYAAAGATDAQGNSIPEGTVIDTRVGGLPGVAGSTPLRATGADTSAPRATPTAPPVAVGKFGEIRVTPDSARPLTPDQQDHIRQMQEDLGMVDTPASFTRGAAVQMPPEVMSRIVDSAFETGVMAQVDFDQLLASQPQQNKQALVDSFRRANITLQADAPSLADSAMGQPSMAANPVQTPQAEFADLRGQRMQSQTAGLRGAPPMEQTLAQYIPVQRRDPNVSPYPGSAQVPLDRLGNETTTTTRAAKNIALKMDPQIAAETKKAENALALRSEAPKAKNETKTLVQSLDNYINDIDELLRSPDRRFIVGRIEGNLHYLGSLGQNERQAELQAMYDRVKNTDTLTSLVEMKQASPSGGSPVGNASNQDVQLVASGANALTQTGGVPKFDEELKKLRRQAYRARQNAIEFYSDRYGVLAADDPKFKLNVRPIADRYISSKDLPNARKTTVKTPTSSLSAKTRAKYGL